ncbi:MAG: FtsQ-type POTRA domain-containing protein [Candidatus Moraniibacteriota bacterium]
MIFSKRKKSINQNFQYRRQQVPSWKSYQPKKGRMSRSHKVFTVKTPKLVISELRLFALKITYNILFLLLAFGVIYFLFFSEWFQISSVLVEGNKTTDKKLVLDTTEPYLHKKSFFLFPSNNYFFVPTSQISREIIGSFKRVSKVEVKRSFPNTIIIQMEEKKAVLIFCSNKGCVWVDEEGVAYNKSSYTEALADSSHSGEPRPKAGEVVIVQDNSHSDLPIGKLVTDPANVDFANRLWHLFPDKIGKELDLLSTPLPSAQEIRAHTKEGWTVYLDMTLDLEKNLELLNRVLNQELKEKEESHSAEGFGGSAGTVCLDYIDLRVVDRVFYKMKDNCPGENLPPENGENQNGDQQVDQGAQEVKPDANSTQPKPADKKKKKKKN